MPYSRLVNAYCYRTKYAGPLWTVSPDPRTLVPRVRKWPSSERTAIGTSMSRDRVPWTNNSDNLETRDLRYTGAPPKATLQK